MARWLGSFGFRQGDASGAGRGCSAAPPAAVRGTLRDIGIFRRGEGDQTRDQPSFATVGSVMSVVIHARIQYESHILHVRGVVRSSGQRKYRSIRPRR
jgi:hypothetical protein